MILGEHLEVYHKLQTPNDAHQFRIAQRDGCIRTKNKRRRNTTYVIISLHQGGDKKKIKI